MIKAEGITKSFGNLQVLKGIDLSVRRKEIVSIVGPSGAGKTTLIKAILGLINKPSIGLGVQNPIRVPKKRRSKHIFFFCMFPLSLAAFRGQWGKGAFFPLRVMGPDSAL